MKATLGRLADAFGWELRGEPVSFDGICTDTRQLCPGQLFIALQGEQYDAHGFVRQALEQGAAGAVVAGALAVVVVFGEGGDNCAERPIRWEPRGLGKQVVGDCGGGAGRRRALPAAAGHLFHGPLC